MNYEEAWNLLKAIILKAQLQYEAKSTKVTSLDEWTAKCALATSLLNTMNVMEMKMKDDLPAGSKNLGNGLIAVPVKKIEDDENTGFSMQQLKDIIKGGS